MPTRRSIHTNTDYKPIIRGNLSGVAGTSGQEGAGKVAIPTARDNEGALGTEDGLVPNEAVTYSDPKGYMEATDENNLVGNLDEDIEAHLAESSTAYPSIAGAKGTARDSLEHDADTPLTTQYPNYTRRLRDTPV